MAERSTGKPREDSTPRMNVSGGELHRLMGAAVDHHQRGRLREAEQIYRRILQAEPGHPDALHLLGVIAQQAGQTEAAIDLLKRAIASNPATSAFHASLAMIYESQDRVADWEQAARDALALDPANGRALFSLANVLMRTDRLEEARDNYEKALELIPAEPAIWSNYGTTLQRMGRAGEAVTALQKAVDLDHPSAANMRSNLGNALREAGRHKEAISAFEEAIRIDPEFAPAYMNLAIVLMQLGRIAEARTSLERCLEFDPGNSRALADLAAVTDALHDIETRDRLLDFDRLITSRRWDTPPGFDSLEDFNEALVAHVTKHGSLMWEPPSKTTRGGSQTGELLEGDRGPVAALESMIRSAVIDYIEALDEDSDHPFISSAPAEWRLTMWATILGNAGHQAAHLHPTGWLSGVYYAAVPPPDASGPEDAGWLEFGRPPEELGLPVAGRTHCVEPEPGLMLLFPSYFYHCTVPFTGAGQRVSIAFDVMPVERSAEAGGRSDASRIRSESRHIGYLLRTGRTEEAEQAAGRLAAAAPDNAGAAHLLGAVFLQSGRVEAARPLLEKACRLTPEKAACYLDLGICCRHLGEFPDAVAALERAAALDPVGIDAHMQLAALYSEHRRTDDARAAYEAAVQRQPKAGGSYYGLAMLEDLEPVDPWIRRMEELLGENGLSARDEAVICFALGHLLDRTDRLDEAMKYFDRGNTLQRGMTAFDIATERETTERMRRAYTARVFAGASSRGDPSELPVFVIGMPRSGTSLVEQILASHPRVFGAGELNDLWRIMADLEKRLPGGMALPEALAQVPAETWRELGGRYVARLRRHDAGADRIVDKLPFNYSLAGMIRLMMPNARIIHCVRDPRDTCLSCYLTFFQSERGFTCDLAELGETYRLYWQLMEHWRQVLPGGLHAVQYERLVEDLEGETRGLIEYLGIPWSDQCLRFFDNKRMVTTASMTQVRRPVYRDSVGRWRRYRDHLAPLLEALGDLRQYQIDED